MALDPHDHADPHATVSAESVAGVVPLPVAPATRSHLADVRCSWCGGLMAYAGYDRGGAVRRWVCVCCAAVCTQERRA